MGVSVFLLFNIILQEIQDKCAKRYYWGTLYSKTLSPKPETLNPKPSNPPRTCAKFENRASQAQVLGSKHSTASSSRELSSVPPAKNSRRCLRNMFRV